MKTTTPVIAWASSSVTGSKRWTALARYTVRSARMAALTNMMLSPSSEALSSERPLTKRTRMPA